MSDIVFGPNDLPLYEALVRRLEASGDFRGAARATRSMLHAIGGKNLPVERALWRRLRAILHERLDDCDGAIECARTLTQSWPGDVDDTLALARLYAKKADAERADASFVTAFTIEPIPATLRELIALRLAHDEMDAAWAATNVLASIADLADDERAFLDARTPRELPSGQLDRQAWLDFAPGFTIAYVLRYIARPVFEAAREAPVSPATWDRRFLPPQVGTPDFRAAFACATHALGLPSSPHFADPEPTASHPSLEAPLDDATRELLFVAGRQAAFHRPHHLVLFHHSSIRELSALLWVARAATNPEAPVPAHLRGFVTSTAQLFRSRMTEDELAVLARTIGKFTAWDEVERRVLMFRDIEDRHAACAGLLLCGDLRLAQRALAAEPRSAAAPPVEQTMKDLRKFALSKQYIMLRERLGFRTKLVVH